MHVLFCSASFWSSELLGLEDPYKHVLLGKGPVLLSTAFFGKKEFENAWQELARQDILNNKLRIFIVLFQISSFIFVIRKYC